MHTRCVFYTQWINISESNVSYIRLQWWNCAVSDIYSLCFVVIGFGCGSVRVRSMCVICWLVFEFSKFAHILEHRKFERFERVNSNLDWCVSQVQFISLVIEIISQRTFLSSEYYFVNWNIESYIGISEKKKIIIKKMARKKENLFNGETHQVSIHLEY